MVSPLTSVISPQAQINYISVQMAAEFRGYRLQYLRRLLGNRKVFDNWGVERCDEIWYELLVRSNRFGSFAVRWAHNPKVPGSSPGPANRSKGTANR